MSLDSLTVPKLKEICTSDKIPGYSTKLKKAELIDLIKTYRAGEAVKQGVAQLDEYMSK